MKPEFKRLRVRQLDRLLKPFYAAKLVPRPPKGWIRALREATGVPLRQLATRLHRQISSIASLEQTEAEYRISLGNLRDMADALDCQLVYALVPKSGTVQELAEQRLREKISGNEQRVRERVSKNVRAVEHSMALEDQAVGNVDEKIREQTDRLLKRR